MVDRLYAGPPPVRPGHRLAQTRLDGWRNAAEAVGGLSPGCRIVGLTYGQFSVLDLIKHVLSETGPAELDIATWRLGREDSRHVSWLACEGVDVTRLRVLLGGGVRASTGRGRELWASELSGLFSPDQVRVATVHAKWFCVRNGAWSICCRSSMNVNRNRRWEQFDIDDDPDICSLFVGAMDRVFDSPPLWDPSSDQMRAADAMAIPMRATEVEPARRLCRLGTLRGFRARRW